LFGVFSFPVVPCQLLLEEDIRDYLHVLATVDFRLLHLSAFSHASSPGTAEPHCSQLVARAPKDLSLSPPQSEKQ